MKVVWLLWYNRNRYRFEVDEDSENKALSFDSLLVNV